MAMDFFKNCTTNVHVVEKLAQTRYTAYKWTETDGLKIWTKIQTTLSRLREQNVLCAAALNEIWLFGETGSALMKDMQDDYVQIVCKGALDSDLQKTSSSGKPLRELLLDAIDNAVAFALAKDETTTRIGPWTWIHHSWNDDDDNSFQSSLIRLHAKFAKTGALYLIPEITTSALLPSRTPAENTSLLLAPYNILAKALPADTAKVISDDRWKDKLTLALQSQGSILGADAEWIPVQQHGGGDDAAVVWPSRLCFSRHEARTGSADILGDGMEWRPWFATTDDDDAYRNPLAMAEEWFQDAVERDRAAAAAAMNGNSTTAIASDAPSTNAATGHGNDANNTISPPLNQRLLDQQAAMAGIYPTPPDGLAQGTQASQMNPVTTPSVTQGDTATSGTDMMPTSEEKSNDSSAMTGPDAFGLGQEDLFGDVEEMEFEENDIGDADFNFFDDDPDNNPSIGAGEDAEMLDASGQQDAIEATPAQDVVNDAGTAKVELSESVAEVLDMELERKEDRLADALISIDDIDVKPNDDIKEEPPGTNFEKSESQPEKPLSPFGIKERLLPPPVPASMAHHESKNMNSRRNSAFSPIIFRSNTNWRDKYAIDETKLNGTRPNSTPSVPDISLPKTRKKSRTLSREAVPQQKTDEESESEEDSFESSSSESEPDLPPKMPWDNRKRKRHSEHDPLNPLAGSLAQMRSNDVPVEDSPSHLSSVEMLGLLQKFSAPDPTTTSDAQMSSESFSRPTNALISLDSLPSLEDTSDLRREDLIYIAQVISEQAVTALGSAQPSIDLLRTDSSELISAFAYTPRKLLSKMLEVTLGEVDVCDVTKIAMGREPLLPPRAVSTPGKTPQGQPPRPPQRADSMMNGPDYFPLQAPYVRIQRGTNNWEMLPSCLSFWETLGLGPASGPKDIRAFCVFPDNDDLQNLVEHFLADMSTAYEGCRLGSHTHIRNVNEKDDTFEDGMAPVELEESSMLGALKAYANTCTDLGKALASFSLKETDRTIVVYMVNPFPGDEAVHHLCACFWQLFRTYRENLPKAHRNQCGSDVVLQLIPITLIAAPDIMVVPDAKLMAILAREVYDRCPPSASAQSLDNTSVLSILAAPSLELASAAPRKIGFSLSAEPPSDLLHEGSILHLAYAVSKDGLWLTAVWVDNTSQYQASSSFCLRGKTFADVADDVWERTREIMAARKVTWRVFIVTHQDMDKSIRQCWRTLSSKPRAQSLCVTLLIVQLDPIIQLSPPPPQENTFDAGFLTPATTPQTATFTSSPDVSGAGAPPTPAPSELADSDPDAHLIDLTDETWGVLLSPKLSAGGLATGALYRRGDGESPLGSLGVTVQWTIQVKPGGAVDEGSPKQGELTLREVLRMFRGLGLLTRARGLEREREGKGPVPVHIMGALRGAKGLEGVLRKQ